MITATSEKCATSTTAMPFSSSIDTGVRRSACSPFQVSAPISWPSSTFAGSNGSSTRNGRSKTSPSGPKRITGPTTIGATSPPGATNSGGRESGAPWIESSRSARSALAGTIKRTLPNAGSIASSAAFFVIGKRGHSPAGQLRNDGWPPPRRPTMIPAAAPPPITTIKMIAIITVRPVRRGGAYGGAGIVRSTSEPQRPQKREPG